MKITKAGTVTSARGPDGRFQTEVPARIGGGTVTFEPGARTA
jgi:hypothetical protein